MSTCTRCGATFHCAMSDAGTGTDAGAAAEPCWCTYLPPAVPVPRQEGDAVGCWCPACLRAHIAALPASRR